MGTIAVDIGYGNMRASLRKFVVNLYNFVCFNFLHSKLVPGHTVAIIYLYIQSGTLEFKPLPAAVRMVSHRGHNCISSALTILDSALTS